MITAATATSATPALPAAPSPMRRRDFPGWLPPMLVKELRQGLRTRGFVGALVVFQLIMLLATLMSLSSDFGPTPSARAANSMLAAFFWTILVVQLLLVTPSRALGGLQVEVDARTLDLLVLTRLNAWRIVLGKWFSLLAQGTLLLVAMLPYLIVRYFTDNADIIADFGRCLIMLGVSALLTAAGLWASGVARVLRVVIIILLAASLPTVAGGFGAAFFGRPFGGGNPLSHLFELPFDLVNAVFLGAFFLVSAVRNIAPPAENHGFFVRVLPLLALLPAAFSEMFNADSLALRQLYIAGGFLALVLLVELASARLPMASQWRVWRRGGPVVRGTGYCSLPGWQSAFAYAMAATATWVVFALIIIPTGTPVTRSEAEHAAGMALLGLAAVVFPAVLRSFVRRRFFSPVLPYVAGIVLPVVLSWFTFWLAESRWKISAPKAVMEVFPVSSFFFGLANRNPATLVVVLQRLVALLVLGVALWQTRPYWDRLRALASSEGKAPPPA
ncbi:MAG: hypothetical protein Q7S40_18675 [Opitutaceae bacterium]|nr:hypothetical protein [Opitutaceae bacterium]